MCNVLTGAQVFKKIFIEVRILWFFREHYSFVGSTTERLAAKTRANEGQSPRGFFVLASLQMSFGVRSSRIHFSSAGPRLPLPSPGLARLYSLFPLNQNRQTTQARKNLCCLKKVQRHHITALGQVTLSLPGLFCVQTHPPHSRFFTEGRGSRGRNYTG